MDKTTEDIKTKEEPVQIVHKFKCSSCCVSETAHYKGTAPPFSRNVLLKYPSYVMKDPFSPPGKGEILVLGADCAACGAPVCVDKECSVFYSKTFCLNCANNSLDKFPLEIRNKLSGLKRK